MKTFKIALVLIFSIFFIVSGCDVYDTELTPLEKDPWKKPEYRNVNNYEYSSVHISSYTGFSINNNVYYSVFNDSSTFSQLLTYSPQPWDSSWIPPAVFETNYGFYVSDKWIDRWGGYTIEGVYYYQNIVYLNYYRSLYPVSPRPQMYESYILVAIERCGADSLIVVENGTEKIRYSLSE